MQIERSFLIAALSLTLFIGTSATSAKAQPAQESKANEWAVVKIYQYSRRGEATEQIKKIILRSFWTADTNGGGVADDDFILRNQLNAAKSRARTVVNTSAMDIDGDGAVSRHEVEINMYPRASQPIPANGIMLQPTPEQVQQRLEKLVSDVMRLDGDGNGVISFHEMLAAAKERYPVPTDVRGDFVRPIPSYLDQNGDGTVSLQEFEAIIDGAIVYVDTDGDGHISPEERDAISAQAENFTKQEAAENRQKREQRLRAERARKLAESCGLPTAPAGTRVVLLDVYEGAALSTVGIGGDDEEVNVLDVRVAPGDEKLFVIATSHSSVIWRFSGKVDRIVHLVADTFERTKDGTARTGVTGLSSELVHFAAIRACTPDYSVVKRGNPKDPKILALADMIGHDLDDIFVDYNPGSVTLPGGHFEKKYEYPGRVDLPKGTPGQAFWDEVVRFNPGGLVRTEPETVVSPLAVHEYDVLPQQAGLAQLIDNGSLKPSGQQKMLLIDELKKAQAQKGYVPKQISMPSALVIQRKITYPAGLFGAHSATFILPPGIPEPDGNPGHSKVIRKKVDSE